jgi:putative FmdB family regulatory protein
MPIYEYKCTKCGTRFEELLSRQASTHVPCPQCGSAKTDKLVSAAGILSSGTKAADSCPSASGCAAAGSSGCGGSCPMSRAAF